MKMSSYLVSMEPLVGARLQPVALGCIKSRDGYPFECLKLSWGKCGEVLDERHEDQGSLQLSPHFGILGSALVRWRSLSTDEKPMFHGDFDYI
jgi:hypothetical protein